MSTLKDITEYYLEVMHILEKNPNTSQRLIVKNSGLSIGKVNYSLKSLIEIGFTKMHSFKNSNQKLQYVYILTPMGIRQKIEITKKFITKKHKEYEKLVSYINK